MSGFFRFIRNIFYNLKFEPDKNLNSSNHSLLVCAISGIPYCNQLDSNRHYETLSICISHKFKSMIVNIVIRSRFTRSGRKNKLQYSIQTSVLITHKCIIIIYVLYSCYTGPTIIIITDTYALLMTCHMRVHL